MTASPPVDGVLHSAIVTEPIDVARLIATAQAAGVGALSVFLGTVRDLNDGRSVSGMDYEAYESMAARELLAKGCSLDLHPRVFAPGQCAQTLLQHANIMLESLEGGALRFYTDRSIAQWVAAWLEDAALEYRGG